ncbi:MAG: helix-turn-helix transcriptional regulator [Burkholderiaceae bacterium]
MSTPISDSVESPSGRNYDPLAGIVFEWFEEPTEPKCMFSSGGLHVHHLAAVARPHTVRMHRQVHTLLVFDEGSFSDGGRRIEGMPAGSGCSRVVGIDVLPAGTELVGWSNTRSHLGVTIISVDDHHDRASMRGPCSLRVGVQMCSGLLDPLSSRLRHWASHQWRDVDALHAESVLHLLLHELVDAQQRAAAQARDTRCQGLSHRAQRLVREFIAENLGSKISLEVLADQVSISRFHFARAFKASFGVSPYRYVLNERVRKAAEALSGSGASITDIAMEVGFSCSNEMSRSFRQAMGCSPRDFRIRTRVGP